MKFKKLIGIFFNHRRFLFKFPDLFRMLRASLLGHYKPGIKNLFISLFVIVYVISPLDLIPGFLVGIGILDDITLTFLALSKLFKEVDKFREWEKQKESIIVIK